MQTPLLTIHLKKWVGPDPEKHIGSTPLATGKARAPTDQTVKLFSGGGPEPATVQHPHTASLTQSPENKVLSDALRLICIAVTELQ